MMVLPWEAGVDIFFVISGFVMVHASGRMFARRGAAGEFVRRRFARVVPLYWLTTTLVLLTALADPSLLNEGSNGVGLILSSYLFLPWERVDGFTQPLFRIGWTLNYEILFYVVFAACIWMPYRRAVAAAAAALLALAAIGVTLRPHTVTLRFWTDPIVAEFVFGMAIAVLHRAGVRWPPWLRAAIAASGLLLLAWVGVSDGPFRPIAYGVPASLFLAACVLRPNDPAPATGPARLGLMLGDASYALYLVHPFPMRALALAWERAGWTGPFGVASYVAAALLLSCLAALWVHRRIEMPLTRRTRRWLAV